MANTLLWGEISSEETQAFAAKLLSEHRGSLERWQSIREPDKQLWIVVGQGLGIPEELRRELPNAGIEMRLLAEPKQWQSIEAGVANFVLRELRPESIFEILPQLHRQIEVVAERPGCVGCTLAAELGKPHNLLGGTYWQDEAAFEHYAEWASQHAWRDTISPVTLQVPLRMLTRRLN